MPSEWKNAAFYNLPAEHGLRVSAKWINGKPAWASYTLHGEELLQTNDPGSVKITKKGQHIELLQQ